MTAKLPLIAVAAALLLAPAAQAQAPAPTPAAAAAPHERLLPLEGGRNFRDLGGYRTSDGRTVRWGLLFRSGSMSGLTAADFRYLNKLGVQTICDFRDTSERAKEPVAWPADAAPRVFADDYKLDFDTRQLFAPGKTLTGEEARQMVAALYPRMLVQFNGQYRRMFGEMLAGRVPLAFNCSAGKDRTGIAAALILTSLGVPRETVIQDYLLTNRYLDAAKLVKAGGQIGAMPSMPPEVLQAFLGADRSYIESALKVVDAHAGGAEGYLRDELGLSQADLKKLRQMYTE